MRLSTRMIATAAIAVLLTGGFRLHAESAARPSTSDAAAAEPGVTSSAEPVSSIFNAPMPEASMAAASPYSAGMNLGTPKVELFLGYSYLRAVPTLATGNRLVWMNGGSASIAFNFNRHLGLVADFGAYTNSQIRFTGGYTSTVDVNNSNVAALTYLIGPRLSFRRDRKNHSVCPGSVWRRACKPGDTYRLHFQLHAPPQSRRVCNDRRRRAGPQGPPSSRHPHHSSRILDDQVRELHDRSDCNAKRHAPFFRTRLALRRKSTFGRAAFRNLFLFRKPGQRKRRHRDCRLRLSHQSGPGKDGRLHMVSGWRNGFWNIKHSEHRYE